jgi:hypothetical protein
MFAMELPRIEGNFFLLLLAMRCILDKATGTRGVRGLGAAGAGERDLSGGGDCIRNLRGQDRF